MPTTSRTLDRPGHGTVPGVRGWAAGLVAAAFAVPGELVEDVAVVVSELYSNAVQVGAAAVEVSVTVERDQVRVEVTDSAAGVPVPGHAGPRDVRGRGLDIVAALSDAWGTAPTAGAPGKTIWARWTPEPTVAASFRAGG